MEHESFTNKPVWAPKRWVLERYGLPVRALERAIADGYVRTVKFGDRRQSQRVLHVADVEKLLLALATGKQPRRFPKV